MASPGEQTAARSGLAMLLWVVRLSVLGVEPGVAGLLAILTDTALVLVHWWANKPMADAEPDRFGAPGTAGSFLAAALMGALLLTGYDIVKYVKMGGL